MNASIKILGTGCPKCKQTIKIVKEVVEKHNFSAEVEKVDDIMEIMNYDVLATPCVVINEKVRIVGRVPNKKELEDLLQELVTQ